MRARYIHVKSIRTCYKRSLIHWWIIIRAPQVIIVIRSAVMDSLRRQRRSVVALAATIIITHELMIANALASYRKPKHERNIHDYMCFKQNVRHIQRQGTNVVGFGLFYLFLFVFRVCVCVRVVVCSTVWHRLIFNESVTGKLIRILVLDKIG